jgi:DNA-binding CsgD family transcriptional regulator
MVCQLMIELLIMFEKPAKFMQAFLIFITEKNLQEAIVLRRSTMVFALTGIPLISLIADAENFLTKTRENGLMITRRESDIQKLSAYGFTNLEIAGIFFISPLTVDSHRENLIVKLQAGNTTSLIKIVSIKGLK